METADIVAIVTFFVTFALGIFSKKSTFIKNEMIPIQNLLVGLLVAIIEWIITKDFQTAILLSGLLAGGTYDVFHNMEKIVKKEVWIKTSINKKYTCFSLRWEN